MEKIIRRTIEKKTATGLFMDAFRNIEERSFDIPKNIKNKEQAEKWYRKNYNGKLVEVLSIETKEELFGMTESEFINNGIQFEERNKENRNMITKVIVTKIAKVLVMTSDRKIVEASLVGVENEKQARKAMTNSEKFIDIISIDEDTKLYGMTREKFAELARPMIDEFHFKK